MAEQNKNAQEQDLNKLLKVRREKLAELQENGKDPFQIVKYDATHHSQEIKDAFDELDSERDYYQEKRKESNDRLIKRKGMIGKVIGFAPMVCLFVGYLIIPLVFIGFTSMSSSFSNMSSGKI